MEESAQQKNQKNILFPDLSIVELIALQILSRHTEPIIRHTLLIEVNQFLKKNIKELSTSSFYNSLTNLERKGLITYTRKSSSKQILVSPTSYTLTVINKIFHLFLRNIIINDFEFTIQFSKKILEKVGVEHFGNICMIVLDTRTNFNNIKLSTKFADNVFILLREENNDVFNKLGIENLNYSKIIYNKIREPNGFFDLVVLSGYQLRPDFYGMSRIELLKEAKRIVKSGGVVVTTARSKLPLTRNFYASELLKTYSNTVKERTLTEQQIKDDMRKAEISKFEIFEFNGIIIGIGWKE